MKKILLPGLILLTLAALFFITEPLQKRLSDESLAMLEQSLQRGAVQCYALEGSYPEDIEYLERHYGISYDQDRYFVDYIYMASNLMPDITVLPKS